MTYLTAYKAHTVPIAIKKHRLIVQLTSMAQLSHSHYNTVTERYSFLLRYFSERELQNSTWLSAENASGVYGDTA